MSFSWFKSKVIIDRIDAQFDSLSENNDTQAESKSSHSYNFKNGFDHFSDDIYQTLISDYDIINKDIAKENKEHEQKRTKCVSIKDYINYTEESIRKHKAAYFSKIQYQMMQYNLDTEFQILMIRESNQGLSSVSLSNDKYIIIIIKEVGMKIRILINVKILISQGY